MSLTLPHACCIPSNSRVHRLEASIDASINRRRAWSGSTAGMHLLPSGTFWMGSDDPGAIPADGECPVRAVTVDPFFIARTPVMNFAFAEFVAETGYRTEAERIGWSYVFRNHLSKAEKRKCDATAPWWHAVNGASWFRPFGPDSRSPATPTLPAVHVSWNDAAAFCEWSGTRLPTEAEWEYACRGGRQRKIYPWGDELTPGGRHMCNVWQGRFPDEDLAEDGFAGIAPADSFDPNGFGLFTMTGNTWEWCADYFDVDWHICASGFNPTGPRNGANRVLKGGSYLCHQSYCNRYRCAARTSNAPSLTTCHIGFRVVRDF